MVGGCEKKKVAEKDEEYGGCQEGWGEGMGVQVENEVPLEVLSGSPPCNCAQPGSYNCTLGHSFPE